MGTPSQAITAPPPPPPGFTLDAPASSVPPPPAGFTLDATPGTLPPRMTPENATSSIGPAPKTSVGDVLEHVANIPLDPLSEMGKAFDAVSGPGTILNPLREYLFGGKDAGKPMGTKSGILNNPVTQAISLAPATAETGEALTAKAGEAFDAYKAARAAKAAKAAEAAESEAVEGGNQLLRTKPKDFKNDVVPGRAIASENVDPDLVESANHARVSKDTVAERQHMQAIQKHLTDSIANLKEQQATLLKHPTGEGFDIRPIVEDSYNKALEGAKQTGSPDIVKAINKAHDEMVKIPNDDGELIADRYLNFESEMHEPITGQTSAEGANEFKKTAQGRANYNSQPGGVQDTPTKEANKLWKDVAAKVRLKLEEQVPGLGDVNTRIRDANAAAKLAEKRINTLRGMSPLPSKMDRFLKVAKPALVKGAAGAVGAGAIYDLYHKFLSGE